MLFWSLYILYALGQAILAARYVFDLDEDESPVLAVVILSILGPITSVGLLIYGFYLAVMWLVTYGRPKKPETEA